MKGLIKKMWNIISKLGQLIGNALAVNAVGSVLGKLLSIFAGKNKTFGVVKIDTLNIGAFNIGAAASLNKVLPKSISSQTANKKSSVQTIFPASLSNQIKPIYQSLGAAVWGLNGIGKKLNSLTFKSLKKSKNTNLYAPKEYWEADEKQKSNIVNGCGPKSCSLDIVPDLNFVEACNIHDWMYNFGKTLEDKNLADKVFLDNMLNIIEAKTKNVWRKRLERIIAHGYYLAVKYRGGSAFWKDKKEKTGASILGQLPVFASKNNSSDFSVGNVKAVYKGIETIINISGRKLLPKTAGKSFLKKIPIVSAIAGLGFGTARFAKGDYIGAGLEVASGLAGSFPVWGTAISAGIDVGLAARDIYKGSRKQRVSAKKKQPEAIIKSQPVIGSAFSQKYQNSSFLTGNKYSLGSRINLLPYQMPFSSNSPAQIINNISVTFGNIIVKATGGVIDPEALKRQIEKVIKEINWTNKQRSLADAY